MRIATLANMRTFLFSIVTVTLGGCGREAKPPVNVGSELGTSHVAHGPNDPSVSPPDAGLPPDPGRAISPARGPSPNAPAPTTQSNQPATPPPQSPGVFAPPPAPEGVPGTPVQQPTPVEQTPTPRDTQ